MESKVYRVRWIGANTMPIGSYFGWWGTWLYYSLTNYFNLRAPLKGGGRE